MFKMYKREKTNLGSSDIFKEDKMKIVEKHENVRCL